MFGSFTEFLASWGTGHCCWGIARHLAWLIEDSLFACEGFSVCSDTGMETNSPPTFPQLSNRFAWPSKCHSKAHVVHSRTRIDRRTLQGSVSSKAFSGDQSSQPSFLRHWDSLSSFWHISFSVSVLVLVNFVMPSFSITSLGKHLKAQKEVAASPGQVSNLDATFNKVMAFGSPSD